MIRRLAALLIAVSAGPLVWLVQEVLRPLSTVGSSARWILGPAPNFIVGVCFPFVALVPRHDTLQSARRAITVWALFTLIVLLVFELWRPIRGARTFDALDMVGSALGAVLGWGLTRSLASRWLDSTG